ncbi:MAG TPA: LytR C-terminal domain-containing protein [Gaiellaceae bacterium]
MEAPVTVQELVRPWRRATFVATSVAAVELVLLVVCGAVLVAGPLSRAVQRRAETHVRNETRKAVLQPPAPVRKEIARQHAAPPKPSHSRGQTRVLVLNGNGRTGVAHAEAAKLQSLGYTVAGAADARRHDYATSLVMYRPGFRPEGVRLARDLHVTVVGPIDGVPRSALQGGQLAVILGAR